MMGKNGRCLWPAVIEKHLRYTVARKLRCASEAEAESNARECEMYSNEECRAYIDYALDLILDGSMKHLVLSKYIQYGLYR
jgi:hypothetical protein